MLLAGSCIGEGSVIDNSTANMSLFEIKDIDPFDVFMLPKRYFDGKRIVANIIRLLINLQ